MGKLHRSWPITHLHRQRIKITERWFDFTVHTNQNKQIMHLQNVTTLNTEKRFCKKVYNLSLLGVFQKSERS